MNLSCATYNSYYDTTKQPSLGIYLGGFLSNFKLKNQTNIQLNKHSNKKATEFTNQLL